jgi:rRNA small subunit pseudouridine methyltransferase Nep1
LEKLILIIVEAAIELVPENIQDHPSVRAYAARRGRKPWEILLDRSYHHSAMKKLPEAEKRGRPDITHFMLLEALGSPLSKLGLLEVYVHARSGHVIWVNPETRLPRVYERFKGVVEKLYREPVVEADGKALLRLEERALDQLMGEIKPDLKILLSERGELMRWSSFEELIASARRPAIMIGGFPHGDFHQSTYEAADKVVSLWPEPLEAWIIVSRTISIVEHALGIGERISRRD